MDTVLTGSVAYDYLMTFPGKFRDHILPDKLDSISLSFLVDSMIRQRGGIAANIAYTMALLGERPRIMATVGQDFEDYRAWLEEHGVDTSAIRVIPELFTASFFVNTDEANAQIASFYTGAMARAADLRFADLEPRPALAVISPNDPGAMSSYVEECIELGIPYLYDPGQQIVRLDAVTLQRGIENSVAVFVNDYEFGLIQEKAGLGREGMLPKVGFLVITRGQDGVDLYTMEEEISVPAVPERMLADPTGVGDAFRGGFFKGYLNGLSLLDCARMGALAATYCVENHGTQGHSFGLPDFIERYRDHFDDNGELDRLQ